MSHLVYATDIPRFQFFFWNTRTAKTLTLLSQQVFIALKGELCHGHINKSGRLCWAKTFPILCSDVLFECSDLLGQTATLEFLTAAATLGCLPLGCLCARSGIQCTHLGLCPIPRDRVFGVLFTIFANHPI